MKNVYIVQAATQYGENVHLPYAAGCIAAYAWSDPVIEKNYCLGHFTVLRTPVAQTVEAFESPFLVAFSNYVWNMEYHKALAQAIKVRWPGCLIVFGGHQVLDTSSEQLNEWPYVDFLIHKAGEVPFRQLLLALLDSGAFSGAPSLSYRGADGALHCCKEPEAISACEGAFCGAQCDFPSPYLTGVFEELFIRHPGILFSMTIESNRGCPNCCAFCDWGADRRTFLHFSMERVQAEIDWAVGHKIEFLICADANFGMFERDESIVDYLIERKLQTGYPSKFNASFVKNSNETVFRLNEKLHAQGLSNGATLSFQSLSPAALHNIGRKNLDYGYFKRLVAMYNEAGVPMYTELILGLPGESLASFARGIGQLLAAGMHGVIEVYPCELLPNAWMSTPAFQAEHGIEGLRIRQVRLHGSPGEYDEVPEYSCVVRQTNSMPADDLVAANLFYTVSQGLHGFGLLSCIAVYLYYEHRLSYERFYFDLIDYAKAHPSTLIGELVALFGRRHWEFSRGQGERLVYYDLRFGELTWPLASALFLCAAFQSERFYAELHAFLQQYHVNEDVLPALIRYQQATVHLPSLPPAAHRFPYDFPGYFAAAFVQRHKPLQKKQTALIFSEPTREDNWVDFARECVWYGRRRGLTRRGGRVVYE